MPSAPARTEASPCQARPRANAVGFNLDLTSDCISHDDAPPRNFLARLDPAIQISPRASEDAGSGTQYRIVAGVWQRLHRLRSEGRAVQRDSARSAWGLGRVKTPVGEGGGFAASSSRTGDLRLLDQRSRAGAVRSLDRSDAEDVGDAGPTSCPGRCDQRPASHDVHDASEIVGEDVQRHFARDPRQRLHQEVHRSHAGNVVSDRFLRSCSAALSSVRLATSYQLLPSLFTFRCRVHDTSTQPNSVAPRFNLVAGCDHRLGASASCFNQLLARRHLRALALHDQ